MTAPLVLLLYNHPLLPDDHPDVESEHTVVEIAELLGTILGKHGFRTALFGLKQDPTDLWRVLKRRKPDLIFNLFEGNLHNTDTESYVAGLLEWSGIPFTGSPFPALTLARTKELAKTLLRGAGLPTADFFAVERLPVPTCNLRWPVIVKPAHQDGSVGIDHDSVCTNQHDLDGRVAYLLETYGPPVLVEEFIAGREFNVAVMELPELRCMPPGEICFGYDRPGSWPILTYGGKWHEDTAEFTQSPSQYPANIPAELADRLCDLAVRAYRLVGCRDYARVDFRVRNGTDPFILEVNPNPEISENNGFARALDAGGIDHADFIVQLAEFALTRCAASFVCGAASSAPQ